MRRLLSHAAAILLLAPACAYAQVRVSDPWVRATVPQQKVSGAFMQLSSPKDMRLVDIRSPVAGVVEIHESISDKGVAKMRPVVGIALPAGKTVELKPGGYHVMLLDLKRQLKAGESVPLTLVLEGKDRKRQTVEVKAAVRPLNTPAHDQYMGH